MTRLLTQGFETRSTAGFTGSANDYRSGTNTRISGLAAEMNGLTFQLHDITGNDITRFYTRFAYAMYNTPSYNGNATRFKIRDSANTTLFHLNFGLNTPITVHLHGVSQPVATIPILFELGWYVFEIYFNYINVPGTAPSYNVEIKLDGVTRVQLTQATSLSTDNPFMKKLGYIDYCIGLRALLDDVAVNDTTGSRDNGWCGDGHVIALMPNAVGDSSQFVGSDGNSIDNHLLVDDFPVNTADYVESSVVGMIDLYNVTNPAPALRPDDSVKRVWVSGIARQLSADGGTLRLGVKSGGEIKWSDSVPLGNDFREARGEDFYVNPSTGQPWTNASLDTLQVGVKPEVAVTPP